MSREDVIRKIQELLEDVGMDAERCNERSAMTFLALAHIDDDTSWEDATGEMYTTREIMDWIRDHLGVEYAPNTRETIRRFTLHQFIAGGIVEYNADDPDRPVNSPKNNYRINPGLLEVVHALDTPQYDYAMIEFKKHLESWQDKKADARGMNKVPVHMPDGTIAKLSAGGQNLLIKAMVEEFCPRFTPGGEIVYIDDTDKQQDRSNHPILDRFGIVIPEHGKAPDLIVWMEDKGWLFLMEACSTHGPIDVLRKIDLTNLFKNAEDRLVFVTCFPDRSVMRKYLTDLAWETEVWVADDPDHMIHLDGERFMGPYGHGGGSE